MVIPATQTSELLRRVVRSEELRCLAQSFVSEHDFTLAQDLPLSSGTVPGGHTLHARLALSGHVRKGHWERTEQGWFSPRVRGMEYGCSELENKLEARRFKAS